MTPTGLDDRIRVLIHDIADAAPAPLPFAELDADRSAHDRPADRSRRRAALVAAAAGLALILAITGAIVWLRSDGGTTRQPAGTVGLIHEVIDYSQRTDVTCPDGPILTTGRFDHMRFEIWGDESLGKFRMSVTYPDGTTRDVLFLANPYYPVETLTRGEIKGRETRCHGSIIGYEPGQGFMYALNPIGPIPQVPAGGNAVLQYSDRGTRLPGSVVDSRGREATLWRLSTSGTETPNAGGATRRITQTQEWLVDTTGRVNELRTDDQIDGSSHTKTRAVLVHHEMIRADPSIFDSAGYSHFDDGQPTTTATVTPISPVTQLGRDWVWPAEPIAQDAASLVRRFARKVLGLDIRKAGISGPIDPPLTTSFLTPNGVTVRLALDQTDRPRISAAGSGEQSIGPGPRADVRLRLLFKGAAVSADVLAGTTHGTLAWHAVLHGSDTIDLSGLDPAAMRSYLLILRDANGAVVGVQANLVGAARMNPGPSGGGGPTVTTAPSGP